MRITRKKIILLILFGLTFLSACHLPVNEVEHPLTLEEKYDHIRATLESTNDDNNINQQSQNPTPTEVFDDSTSDPAKIYLHPGLQINFDQNNDITQYLQTDEEDDADIKVLMGSLNNEDNETTSENIWVYVLAAPFYTISDNVNQEELAELWRGERGSIGSFSRIYVTESTKEAISTIFGPADETVVSVISLEAMQDISMDGDQALMILPFDALNKKMKVIRIGGQAPIDQDFDRLEYPLSIAIWIESDLDDHTIRIPESNYDPNLRTILVMTGVTAMTRATAYRMEIMGNQYPGQDIVDWLTSADLTHISNEVPFAANCPPPDPVQQNLIFCSSPSRIELLEYVGADIIELSGNHLLDYGLDAVNLTLEMYDERGWETYAGGWDLADSQSPAILDHNGNRLAFIGCNTVGPPNAWASTSKPGAAPCGDFLWMTKEIQRLKEDGYLPIVTLQYAEDYTAYPSMQMAADFQMLADAGAVIVNGSQAHTPKIMAFQGESFLHYGLGNLFFDQMEVYYNDVYLSGTRDEFIDRLIFYDGELISIELLTALLEDYARPRPMSTTERDTFLKRIYLTAMEFDR